MYQTLQASKPQSSLLGTTARQKLLALKLAKAAKCDDEKLDIEKLDLKVDGNDNLNRTTVLSAKKAYP